MRSTEKIFFIDTDHARLAAVLAKSSRAARLTPGEKRKAILAIYGHHTELDPEPEPVESTRALPDIRHLRPALARSAARLAALLANPTDPANWSAERRQAEIRRIYGRPPEPAS